MNTRLRRMLFPALYGGWAVDKPWYLADGDLATRCVYAYCPVGAASLAASYNNIAAPGNGLADGTYDATAVAAPTFDPTEGWVCNADALATGYSAAAQAETVLIRIGTTTTTDGSRFMGYKNTTPAARFYIGQSTTNIIFGNGVTTSYFLTAGSGQGKVLGISNKTAYIDGLPVGTLAAGTLDAVLAEYIGCWNADGSRDGSCIARIIAVARYSVAKTDAQMLALSTAMAAISYTPP